MVNQGTRSALRHVPVEEWLVDVIRLGAAGQAEGVRQLGKRLLRSTVDGVADVPAFRAALTAALSQGVSERTPGGTGVRRVLPSQIPTDSESGLALAELDQPLLAEPILPDSAMAVVQRFIEERRRASELTAAGLTPSSRLLIVGPPGTGKTMTARYIAAQLDLPILAVDLSSVMSSYLGRTGQNLRMSLEYARSVECVLLLDEFDALAKRRDDDSDIGELKRLVNVLLLELERWPWQGVLIAASNHPELLDRAVARRFDAILDLQVPSPDGREQLITNAAANLGAQLAPQWKRITTQATAGWSGSDLVRLLDQAARTAALGTATFEDALAEALKPHLATAATERGLRDELCRIASTKWGLSRRGIAQLLGISHPTVARALASAER